jgi:hypothetical protein
MTVLFAEGPKITTDGGKEVLSLNSLLDPSGWEGKKGTTITKSEEVCPVGKIAINIRMEFAPGERTYPYAINEGLVDFEADWSQWEAFEFTVMPKSNRKNLPRCAVSPCFKDGAGGQLEIDQSIKEVGKWETISIPISKLQENNIAVNDIGTLRFNNDTKYYKAKDWVDFNIGGFRLVRAKK